MPLAVAQITRIILDTFEVSESEARESAEGLFALAEGWGGAGSVQPDWKCAVKKHFGERFKWRSESVRQQFLSDNKATITAYESYLRARR